MRRNFPSLIEVVIVLYTATRCWELLLAWNGDRVNRLGWLAFLIWCMPAIVGFTKSSLEKKPTRTSTPWLLGVGLFLSLLGTLGSLNALHHAGFACAVAGLLPASWKNLVWLACGVSWTPALGWLGLRLFPSLILPVRLLLAAAGSFYMLALYRWPKREFNHE